MGDTDEVGRLEGRNDGNDVDGDDDGRRLARMEGCADWDGAPVNCVEGDNDGVNDGFVEGNNVGTLRAFRVGDKDSLACFAGGNERDLDGGNVTTPSALISVAPLLLCDALDLPPTVPVATRA